MDRTGSPCFLKLTGQALQNILNMTMAERRSDMEASIPEHFQVLYALPPPTEFSDILEHCAIVKEMFRLFINKESRTYEIAKINCRYLKYSKYKSVLL